jgi:hypothetical protein
MTYSVEGEKVFIEAGTNASLVFTQLRMAFGKEAVPYESKKEDVIVYVDKVDNALMKEAVSKYQLLIKKNGSYVSYTEREYQKSFEPYIEKMREMINDTCGSLVAFILDIQPATSSIQVEALDESERKQLFDVVKTFIKEELREGDQYEIKGNSLIFPVYALNLTHKAFVQLNTMERYT